MTQGGATSLRERSPAETLSLATRLMPALGISRVADITRMDRLGLPVFSSIRPRGLALCVNAGKGMSPLDAHVGALMEAIEFAVAEPGRSDWRGRSWRMGDLEKEWNGELSRIGLAPRIGATPTPERPIQAAQCEDVAGGRAMWLPAELIFMPYGDDECGDDESGLVYGWSSNGLASGNSVNEATLHAIFEVLERDALAMHAVRDESLWLSPDCMPEPFGALAERWRELGIALSARYVPNVFGLPCFRAMLHESGCGVIGLAEGSGLHFDARIALSRAICEAAQARLSHIHGGRDDITRFFEGGFGNSSKSLDPQETLAYLEAFDTTRQISWDGVPSQPCRDIRLSVLLDRLVDLLSDRGFRQIFRHCFKLDLGGLHVVKVVVPGCELIDHEIQRVGPRLRQRAGALHA